MAGIDLTEDKVTLIDRVDQLTSDLEKAFTRLNELDDRRSSHDIRIERIEKEVGLAPRNPTGYK